MFNLFDPSTYSEVPDGYACLDDNIYFKSPKDNHLLTVKEIVEHIQKVIIPEYENPFILDKQIHIYIEWLYNICSTDTKENKEKRKILYDKNRNELVKAQLKNLNNITRKNQFNPRDEKTYKYAKDNVITVIDGIPIYHEWVENDGTVRKYLFEKEFVTYLYEMYEHYYHKSFQDFINSEIKRFLLQCSGYDVKKSDLTIKGYNFTIAQKEMMKYLSQEEKEKLTDIILLHFKLKEQKYRLRQDIFDNLGAKIDNYLFADLCHAKDLETEQEIMQEYYSSFDLIESQEELNFLLNNDYLNLYPELKKEIKEQLITNLGF